MTYTAYYRSEIGWLSLTANDEALIACNFVDQPTAIEAVSNHPLLKVALAQLHEYFQGQRRVFSLPLQPAGRAFSQRVWQQLQQIPFATTVSYQQVAIALGSPQAMRAVGQANRRNPLVLFIPCHRVIASHGKLGGYSEGLWRKEWLLAHEQQVFLKQKVAKNTEKKVSLSKGEELKGREKAKPFLKWAGGKTQLLAQYARFYPPELKNHQITHYVEPFLGSGAVFFDVVQKFNIQTAYLADVNRDLILTYQVIQQETENLLDFLARFQQEYDICTVEERKIMFLEVREHFNSQRFEINYKKMAANWIPRAAQLIFLNKTCFNGLFRLNLRGMFNVPFGDYKHPKIVNEANLLAVAKILKNTEICCAPYEKCFNQITNNTFVYFDPPYRPLSQTASFTTYNGGVFTDKQQVKLAAFFKKVAKETSAKLMLSNSDPKNSNPTDPFFENLYSGYPIQRVQARRAINSNPHKRGQVDELVITNYDVW